MLDAYERMRWGIIKRNICVWFAWRESDRVDRVEVGNVRSGGLGTKVDVLQGTAFLGCPARRYGLRRAG